MPSGNTLITNEAHPYGPKFILIKNGPGFAVEVIEANNFTPGTDEFNNKEIEIWQQIKAYS